MDPPTGEDRLPASVRWVKDRAAWAVPQEIRDAAPEGPAGLDVDSFARSADQAMNQETPSRHLAREALREGGSVLDVGCGAGAGGLPLVPPADLVIGVDPSPGMLAAFAQRAEALGVHHQEIEGPWPDVNVDVPVVDVVVCHHVVFGIADLVPFVRALSAHARRRVVVQIPQEPPQAWTRPYWKALHGLDLPDRPTADDAAAVVREAGFDPQIVRWERPARDEGRNDRVTSLRRGLFLGPERDADIRDLLERFPPPPTHPMATLWWQPATSS